jgi:hypothetical protein
MTTTSYTERMARRGALPEGDFLDAMRDAGFRVVPVRRGFVWDFEHPDVPGRIFAIPSRPIENYNQALPRLIRELSIERRNLVAK